MKAWQVWRLLGLAVCCCLLAGLLAGGVQAQPAPQYQVNSGTISGGAYRLAIAGWQVTGAAAGGAYRLLGPPAPGPVGSGCCCTYLPCAVRDW